MSPQAFNQRKESAMKAGYGLLAVVLGLTASWLVSCPASPLTAAARPEVVRRVCPDGCPYTSVQAAVDEAQEGDLIQVAAGTYAGVQSRPAPSGYEGPAVITQALFITKTVTVQGGYAPDFAIWDPDQYPTLLDAQGRGRGIVVMGENITVTLAGLRVTGGDGRDLGGIEFTEAGGGVVVYSATISLSDCQVFSNTADYGGGVWVQGSFAATLRRNTILSNTADYNAGIIVHMASDVVLEGNRIQSNVASQSMGGGAVFLSDRVWLTENLIQSNVAGDTNGGLWVDGNTHVVLQRNTILSNTAPSFGGVYLQLNPDAIVRENHILSNTDGGLILWGLGGRTQITITDNLIQGNLAGGIYGIDGDTDYDSLWITDNTIQGNLGSGVMLEQGLTPQLHGNTILSNTAGAGLYLRDIEAAVISQNLIRGNHAAGEANGGGGISLNNCFAPVLSDNVIINNRAQGMGGGLYLADVAEATLDNTVMADNQAGVTGDGVYMQGSTAAFRHTTLARNGSSGIPGDGSGLSLHDSEAVLTNTVLVSHTVGITNASPYGGATLNGVLWYGNAVNAGDGAVISATQQITGPPAFAGDGYHLRRNSAAIDAGADSGLAVDIDGDPRRIGTAPDLGADEYRLITLVPDYVRAARPGGQVHYRHTLTNDTTDPLVFDLVAHSSQGWEVALSVSDYPSSTGQLPYPLLPGGSAFVTVTVQVPSEALGLTDITVLTATAAGIPTLWTTVTDSTQASLLFYLPLVLRGG